MQDPLRQLLFPEDGENTYAVLDGAACGELLPRLDAWQPDRVCLYPGELEPGVEEVAPHLVGLRPDHPFTDWLLADFLGKHRGVLARSPASIRALRKHFRTLLFVRGPEARLLYFRFYDPRVLTAFLPTTDAREREAIFGPVSAFFGETGAGDLAVFRRDGTRLDRQTAPGASFQKA